ncbi:hypothetical protein HAX54_015046 [Datura stramonium]|uniref:Uncharacterized protein n=1 Tax=Datura stramonium TaxID=4076 RepID=A0ABS8TRA3_DATST|nr:hypothetical protein [Datura stramonium]
MDYRPNYDLKGIDVTKTKDPEGIHSPLRMNGLIEEKLLQLNMDYPFSEYSRALCRGGPGFDEPLDDDDATDEEYTRVDSMLESDQDEDNFEMGEAALSPTDDED